ncbi:UDP-GlcNAc:undecaprenyl-phosphate GlcNAc-1-phosphate transferase [Thermotomaculum hydrothermale]|uniref:UDP-GlcNAc:undecaprenyl-phosphate GlcNAc-1-phosphate transferase n=1 Tax=Thermotomaculum hydrothermale TaxID=981385 RepID=A0A7R6SZ85_9BACT|nr:MraY family glycosyltransferase [Thermotomaculum hydrothermale]BBB33391.1 UDP-GlcNAc:undecaprenyl-phosphate GlcNAc-1-phosphate transferase [Thermotomaculum hydrothermale]
MLDYFLKLTTFSFIINTLLIPLSLFLAKKINIVDYPDKRKIHIEPTPRSGGIAIFLTFLLTILVTQKLTPFLTMLIIANTLIFLIGIIDDKYNLSAYKKLAGEFIVATLIIFWGSIRFKIGGNYTGFLNSNLVSILLSYMWIIGVTNAINLIDGMDGLAGGISFLSFCAIITIAITKGFALQGIIAGVFLGSIISFLNFNLPMAKLFLGDSGSLLLGFNIAILSLSVSYKTGTLLSVIFPSLFVLIPVIDTIYAFFRRIIKGKNPLTTPDREHLHHKLLLLKFSRNQALIIFYFFSGIFTTIAISLKSKNILYGIIFSLSLIFLLFLAIYMLEKNKVDEKIEKFNHFTDKLKQKLLSGSNEQNNSLKIFIILNSSLYVLALYAISSFKEYYNIILVLLFISYIILAIISALLKEQGKMLLFINFWIDFLLIYVLVINGYEKMVQIILIVIFPFFLYKLISRKKFIILIPTPTDILLFFSILTILILKKYNPDIFPIIFYTAIFYTYKKIISIGNLETTVKFSLLQSLIFVLFLLSLIL